MDIGKACIDTYAAIVEDFRPPLEGPSEVWMFGLSRGAYTVRSVCGMINNWGILSKAKIRDANEDGSHTLTSRLCATVYAQLRSPDEVYRPKNDFARQFKRTYCHDLEKAPPPVKFMGLFDTVGALGVPRIDSGLGLSYEFYDQIVSTEVQNVYQALAIHDRLKLFTPCFARRNENRIQQLNTAGLVTYVTEELWFPGAHYDIGRQRFVAARKVGWLERMMQYLGDSCNILGMTVRPTDEYSDAALQWMLNNVATHDPDMISANARNTFVPSVATAGRARVNNFVWAPLSAIRRRIPWWVPFSPELSINAYDTLVNRMLPFRLKNVFAGLVLQDRRVPLYRGAMFRGMVPRLPMVEHHISQTYQAYQEQARPLQAALNGGH